MNNQDAQINEVFEKDSRVIENLLQLYQYDWSEILDGTIQDNALYNYIDLQAFWTRKNPRAFLLKVTGEIAGFAMVEDKSITGGSENTHYIEEFFVMRKFRRHNFGKFFAENLFNIITGDWEVWENNKNVVAVAFWKKVISEFTNNNYEVREAKLSIWDGVVQKFRV